MLILRGGIPRPIWDFPESLTRAMLVGTMLVGGLGVGEPPCGYYYTNDYYYYYTNNIYIYIYIFFITIMM